jgi:hypothetical protein
MRKTLLAVICFCLALTPMLAEAGGGHRGYDRGYHKPHGGYYKPYGGYHKKYHGRHYRKRYGGYHKPYGHRRHHKRHDDDDIEAGEIIAGVFLGGLLLYALTRDYDRPRYRAPAPRYQSSALYDCRWTSGQNYEGGRVRLYEGLLCRSSQSPGWHIKPGSVRFLGYAR